MLDKVLRFYFKNHLDMPGFISYFSVGWEVRFMFSNNDFGYLYSGVLHFRKILQFPAIQEIVEGGIRKNTNQNKE